MSRLLQIGKWKAENSDLPSFSCYQIAQTCKGARSLIFLLSDKYSLQKQFNTSSKKSTFKGTLQIQIPFGIFLPPSWSNLLGKDWSPVASTILEISRRCENDILTEKEVVGDIEASVEKMTMPGWGWRKCERDKTEVHLRFHSHSHIRQFYSTPPYILLGGISVGWPLWT